MDNPYKTSDVVHKNNHEILYPKWALIVSLFSVFLFEAIRFFQINSEISLFTLPGIVIIALIPAFIAFAPALPIYLLTPYSYWESYHLALKYLALLWSAFFFVVSATFFTSNAKDFLTQIDFL